MSKVLEKMVERIHEATAEATRRGIKANTILIGKNLAEVKPFGVRFLDGKIGICPPMICGLEVIVDTEGELPDGYDFAVLEAPETARERAERELVMKVLGEIVASGAKLSKRVKATMANIAERYGETLFEEAENENTRRADCRNGKRPGTSKILGDGNSRKP